MTELVLVANAGDATLSTFQLTPDGLERLAVSRLAGKCSTVALDPERSLVYAAVGGEDPGVTTLRLDPVTGALTPIAHRRGDAAMTYLSLTADGRILLGACYQRGYATTWTAAGGELADGPARLNYPNAHCVVPTADGRFAYVVSLGADLVVVCAIEADGGLRVVSEVPAPDGSGPRHLILNAAEDAAYVLTEFGGEALHYRRGADGGLTLTGRACGVDPARGLGHSRYGADPRAEHLIWGADLQLSADGRHLWCTERTESTLATLPVSADGTLGEATAFADVEAQPRGICLTGDGRLLVTGERSRHVSLYTADDQGVVHLQARAETGAGANWARTVSTGPVQG